MESSQAKLNINLGSKRKGSIDEEETEVKRKIPRSFVQTINDETEHGLNLRVSSAENDLISTENKTQNSHQSCILYLRNTTDESINLECTTKKTEDKDNFAENELISNDNESRDSDLPYTPDLTKSKTGSNKDESSIKKPEDEGMHIKEDHTTNTNRDRQASLKVGGQELQAIYAADENSLKERDATRVTIAEGAEKVNEQEEFGINTDVSHENSEENFGISIPVVDEEVVVEQKPDKYVYRILRFDETYHDGLRPKNIFSRISLQQHVERGSKGQKSRFISCCKSLYGIRRLGNLTNEKHRRRDVVKINISKLNNRAEVIDLTREEIRERHITRGSNAWDYAEKFEEVIIDPTSHVPSEYVEKIGIVHRRSFSHT